ncbi:MAG: NAD-dependent dehydratase [Solirubrobacterales bacterium]|nr:NAD-dependent dehydratase [Solirubrobacterales bacterium]
MERMDVVVAGAHGKVGRRLTRLLRARGDRVRGLIRKEAETQDVLADGAEPIVCDLESATVEDVVGAVTGADAVVFAAGAGPGSGAARKLTMDRDGAIRLLRAAEQTGVPRYVMVSSVGAENPPAGDDVFAVYLQAKAEADAVLMASALAWTIVRPGRLTDEPGTGRVRVDTEPHRGEVPRNDVAAVLDAVLHTERTVARILYVNSGDLPILDALGVALK